MPTPPAAKLRIRPSVRLELEALLTLSTTPKRTVRRASILLYAAAGVSNAEISRQRKIARQHVTAIRPRFDHRGMESVYKDAAGRGRPRNMREETTVTTVEATIPTMLKGTTH